MWQVYAVMAAASLAQGAMNSSANKASASSATATSNANAQAYEDMGNYNADVYLATGEANAANIMKMAEMNAGIAEDFADYNADIIEMVAEYNALLNENDARYVIDAAEIEVDQTDKQIRQLMGKNRAYYAGAGVQVNSGSPVDAEIDVRTQGDIDISIIRRGAVVEAAKFQDAAAMTKWQGDTDATLTRYQGRIQGFQTRVQGGYQSSQVLATATNQANMSRYQGEVNGIMTRFNGQQQASLYNQQASQSMRSGVIGAASMATQAYMGYKWMQGQQKPAADPRASYAGTPINRDALILPQSKMQESYSPMTDFTNNFESKWGLLS